MKYIVALFVMLLGTQGVAKKEECLAPPPTFGNEIPLIGCEQAPDKSTICGYSFNTMFPKDQFWSCVILMVQKKCRLPFEPYKVVCEPAPMPAPAGARR